MYQLGLAATIPEVPRMSFTLGANRWASRVVVVLQLAAWTAVGIVLLQKGVSSLQKTAKANRNVTQLNYTETVSNLMMQKIAGEGPSIGSQKGEKHPAESGAANDDSMIKRTKDFQEKTESVGRNSPRNEADVAVIRNPENNPYEDLTNPNIIKEEKKNSVISTKEEGEKEIPFDLSFIAPNPRTPSPPNSRQMDDGGIKKTNKLSEVRSNLRPSNRHAGGAAAAAVAMVAVGAVMLILGPAVIVLRALDERRQERRFLKLSGQDDLPPSYEQATLMDEAPRYSTLSLNTILGSAGTREPTNPAPASDRCDADPSIVQEV